MSYTGTRLGQDIRFKDPDKNTLLSMKTPKIFETTVSKKNIIILPIIKLWLTQKIIELLEFEDETLVNLIINLINSSSDKIDPKNMQYQISGFLGDKTYSFMKKFWKLLISVQESYLQDKKIPDELRILKEEDDKKKSMNKKLERYKEYEDDLNEKDKNDYKYEHEDKTKIELMKVIDAYKKDERYKIRNKSRSRSYEKRRHKSRSREHERKKEKEKEEYKYRSRSRSRKRHRRSRSSSRSKSSYKERRNRKEREEYDFDYRKNKSRKRKYSKDYSSSSSSISPDYPDYYNYHSSKRNKNKKEYDDLKHRKDRSISSSSDSSETFKI